VALSFQFGIRVPAPPDHPKKADRVWNCRDQTHFQLGEVAEILDDLGQPEADAIIGGHGSEIDERQRHHPAIGQGLADAEVPRRHTLASLGLQSIGQPRAFFRLEPVRLGGTIGQEAQHDKRKNDCWQCLQDEHPLPSFQSTNAVHIQQSRRERRTEHG
jgi:hypothetical protein